MKVKNIFSKKWSIAFLAVTTSAFSLIAQPVVPTLSAATNIDCSSFIANWNVSAGANFYYLEVSTSTSFGTFVGIYSPVSCGNNLTWFVSGLSASTTYYYRVSASNGSGNSGYTAGTYTTVTTLSSAGCSSNGTWTQVGSAANGAGVTNGDPPVYNDFEVASMCSDCKNNVLYVGGYYTSVNNTTIPASGIATWTPSTTYPYTAGTWASLGTIGGGLAVSNGAVKQNPHEIFAMVYYNGIVYVGGNFTTINGSATDGSGNTYNNLAQYNISTGVWSAVGGSGGITGGSGTGKAVFYSQGPVSGNIGGYYVQSLAVDYSGRLYVGGNFTNVAGATKDGSGKNFNNIAMWNGSSWSALNGGMTGTNSNSNGTAVPTVYALDVLDSVHIYAGGQFNLAGGISASNIAMWNGSAWSSLTDGSGGNGIPQGAMGPSLCGGIVSGTVNWSDCPAVLALANVGNLVYAAGVFNKAGSKSADNVAQWNQSTNTWTDIGGVGGPTNDIGEATAEYVNNGILYIGGDFQNANHCALTVNNVVGYNGSWILLPASAPGFQPGLSNVLSWASLAGFPSPGYSILYAGGDFEGGTNGPGAPAVNHIAQYAGLPNPAPILTVSPSASICSGGNSTLTAGGAVSYTWSPGASLNVTTGATVIATPTATTTYTVTGTNVGGCACACTQTATVVVTVSSTTTVTASAVTPTFCAGDSTKINASGATTYTWTPSTGLNVTTGASVVASPVSSQTYIVTGGAAGCTATATVVVTVNPAPTINATADTATICAGNSTNINATGGSTYTWTSSTGLSATTGGTVKATPGSSITYTVTGTDVNGCINKATVSVAVTPTPTINASAVSSTICPGSSTNINATGATTYTWASATGLNQTTGATVSANPASAITYTVTGTTAPGCVGTATVSIAIAPSLSVTITPSGGTILCNGASVTLNAGGATSYSWSPPGGLSCTGCSNPTANPGSTTTYTVTGTSGTCIGKDSVVITINSTPTINITPSAPAICTGDSVTLIASGATSYTWSPPGGLSCTSCSNTTAIPGSTSTYTVVGTIAGGCSGKDSVVVSINPTPTVSVKTTGIASEICPGDTIGLVASGATTYTWSPATGLNVTTGIHVIASPGATTTYTVTGYNGNSCSDTASIVVLVYPKTNVSILPTNPIICFGDSVTLNASGATTYSWLPNSGLSCVLCSNPSVSPATTTTYTVTGKGNGGCASKDSITVTINPLPILTIKPSAPVICKGASVPLVVSGATSYTWSPPGGLSCTSCDSTTANPGSTVIYTVTGTSAGCTAKDSVTVTIDIPVVAISASSSTVCSGGSTMLSATGAANYTWSPPGGLSCTSCSNTTAILGSTTSYSVVGIDTNGCSDSAVVSISVAPKLKVIMPNDSICSGASGNVSVNISGGTPAYTYTWSNTLGTGTGPYVVKPVTSTYYYCTVTDGCGDTIKDSSHVMVVSSPHVSFTGTPGIIPGGQYVTFTNTSTNATSFYWNFGNGDNSTDSSGYEQYNAQGSYVVYLVGSNALGCADTAWDTIYVTQGIYVPNVFTPNGDGQNDVFHVTASGLQTYNIEIFNRWGQRVFTADSPNIDWSGRSTSGVEDSDGTYYYIIKATDYHNTKYNFHGYLELIR